jgi:hypothetical protein
MGAIIVIDTYHRELQKEEGCEMRVSSIRILLSLLWIPAFAGMTFIIPSAFAEDPSAIMDRFYEGLAGVIENNMEDPDGCISEVEDYYAAHQAEIREIRKITAKSMEQASAMMDEMSSKYDRMSEEELAALEKKMAGEYSAPRTTMSSSMARFEFTKRYPSQGAMISVKAMELLPEKMTRPVQE